MNTKTSILVILILVLGLASCSQSAPSVPKPKAYPRIDRGDTIHLKHNIAAANFSYPSDGELKIQRADEQSKVWFDIEYNKFDATLYCSYMILSDNDLQRILDDNKTLLEKQSSDFVNIYETSYTNAHNRSFGSIYHLEGSPVTPLQFYLTDSVSYFLRGSLYYNQQVNIDSVASVTNSLRGDIEILMETFRRRSIK